MSFFRMAVLALAAVFVAPTFAEEQPTDSMQILLDKIKADKKLLVAANMDLTEGEAKGFWPIYEEYQKELAEINRRLADLIVQYADAYNSDTLTDNKARTLMNDFISLQASEVKMKKAFMRKLGRVMPMKKVARYLQIENKIRAAVNYELAARVPLVE